MFAQDFLESCRAPTLLAELEDTDEMPDEDENDDDENEDDDDYEEVMVSRNLLSFMVCNKQYLFLICKIVRFYKCLNICIFIIQKIYFFKFVYTTYL